MGLQRWWLWMPCGKRADRLRTPLQKPQSSPLVTPKANLPFQEDIGARPSWMLGLIHESVVKKKQGRQKENMTCERLITAQAFSDSSKDNSFLALQQRPRQLWSLLNPAFTLRRRSVLSLLSSQLTKQRSSPHRLALNSFLLYYTFPFARLTLSMLFFFSVFLANANDSPAVQFRKNFPSLGGWGKGNRQ